MDQRVNEVFKQVLVEKLLEIDAVKEPKCQRSSEQFLWKKLREIVAIDRTKELTKF